MGKHRGGKINTENRHEERNRRRDWSRGGGENGELGDGWGRTREKLSKRMENNDQ